MSLQNLGRIPDDIHVLLVLQVASTSRASSGPSSSRGGGTAGNGPTNLAPSSVGDPSPSSATAHERSTREDGIPQVLAVREGEPLPEGYTLVVRAPTTPGCRMKPTETVDLSTPPDCAAPTSRDRSELNKRKATDQRNATRSANKQAHASYTKEVKEALADGRPPTMNVNESQTHLKARWHAAAKEVAYKFLDLRKEGWKSYTMFEKSKVHRELKEVLKIDPPDPRKVEKYLAGHLRSARAVWKAHWLAHGDDARHPNCPEEAWETLIRWWSTEACKEQSAAMASRRSLVHNVSKTGRKRLVDRMLEQVR